MKQQRLKVIWHTAGWQTPCSSCHATAAGPKISRAIEIVKRPARNRLKLGIPFSFVSYRIGSVWIALVHLLRWSVFIYFSFLFHILVDDSAVLKCLLIRCAKRMEKRQITEHGTKTSQAKYLNTRRVEGLAQSQTYKKPEQHLVNQHKLDNRAANKMVSEIQLQLQLTSINGLILSRKPALRLLRSAPAWLWPQRMYPICHRAVTCHHPSRKRWNT